MSAFSDSEELSRNKGLSQIYITYTPSLRTHYTLFAMALTTTALTSNATLVALHGINTASNTVHTHKQDAFKDKLSQWH